MPRALEPKRGQNSCVVRRLAKCGPVAPGLPRGGGRNAVTLLEVKDLKVSFPTADGVVRAVRGVSFTVDAGRTLGIVGESGSGKSVMTQTLLGLTPGGEISGSAVFDGVDLLTLGEDEMRKVRGAQISVIFQDPLTSMHPLYRVGWQISELIRAHDKSVSKREARERSIDLLRRVGIPRPETRVDDYPHQFSGGMRQRAIIAMALALSPKLIIADEPTTALDATVQAQILDLLLELQRESDTALIMITHDMGVVADIADDVMVMYAGRAAERAGKDDIFYAPHHPYTKGLLESIPNSSAGGDRLKPITGQPPSLIRLPSGCKFHPRCGYVMDRCLSEEPTLRPVGDDGYHVSACWLPTAAAGLSEQAEEIRKKTVRAERSEASEQIAEEIAAAPESEGSVI
ncbi:MAG: ABC transporter ATP-binding protein [Actinobacteria bacterium]|nr:ABC transporter ATP-binding protein [Actinomycetota bacterium]